MPTFEDLYRNASSGAAFLKLEERNAMWKAGTPFYISRIDLGHSQLSGNAQWVLAIELGGDTYLLGLNRNPVRDRIMEAFARQLQQQTTPIGPARLTKRRVPNAPTPMWEVVPHDIHLEDEVAPSDSASEVDEIPFS